MKDNVSNIPMVDLKAELKSIRTPVLEMVSEVLDSGVYIQGEKVEKLEKIVASYVEASYGLGVGNGTDALLLSIKALDIGPGDEVITTPFTFFATGEAIAEAGATPVFVDIEEDTYNINPLEIEKAITENTKAIIVVHLFGKVANMKQIMEIAKTHHLKVIEDACQAIGSEYEGKRVGAIGDIGCFSFFPSKNLGAYGDAGFIVTNQQGLYEKMKMLRNHGSEKKYQHALIGMNSRLDELQAGILLVKFNFLDTFLQKRKEIANRYTESLSSFLKTPQIYNNRAHTFHQYCIELDDRDKLAAYLQDSGISSAIYYPIPLHLQQAFSHYNYKKGDFPVAERTAERILALPISPMLTSIDQTKIIATVNEFVERL
ncbi:DegT/DnrJ/EryC1/StrS family aminotransferase [Oceanobacillus bengalensis]|uniref:DegT/DnrJ/EryC1/StrS family aminotransferase n=1 Tax=Oceanobacillus bengalensis TaxID=1435466 RepID=A0A494Z5F4_9BACI|nr:DegT/DnrJ/EryC1/StrS family aminotransferase [Oceanobacillus bengalensis]RKQ17546.1 DegT/DnrJ/EryC1/StrS family aminotransferase [Oceanobacillus bengalensis]